jgi:hypothetical protein
MRFCPFNMRLIMRFIKVTHIFTMSITYLP